MLTVYNQNLHTHGVLCDGRDAYEDTVLRAMELGFDSIGFSGHSYMSYSPSHSMSVEGTEEYKREIARLKEKYAGQIDVFCGIEFDMYSSDPLVGYDYILGSVHYLLIDGEYVGFDRDGSEVERVINTYFGGDGMKYAKCFYETLAELPKYAKSDIVAHYDLIAKHCEQRNFFDVTSREYRNIAMPALEVLSKEVGVFEVNTGAIARGYRTTPYPDLYLLKEMKRLGCSLTISSDCHDNRFLNHGFAEALEMIRACGFREVLKLTRNGFVACPI